MPKSLSERGAAELRQRWEAHLQQIENERTLLIGHASFCLAATGASILATLAVHRDQPSALLEKAMTAIIAALEHLASDPRGGTATTNVATLGYICPGLAELGRDNELVWQSMWESRDDHYRKGLRKKLEQSLAVAGAADRLVDLTGKLKGAEAPLRKAMASLAVVTEVVAGITSMASNRRASRRAIAIAGERAEAVLFALLVGSHGLCPTPCEAKVCCQQRSPPQMCIRTRCASATEQGSN